MGKLSRTSIRFTKMVMREMTKKKKRQNKDFSLPAPTNFARFSDSVLLWIFLPLFLLYTFSYKGLFIIVLCLVFARYKKWSREKEYDLKRQLSLINSQIGKLSPSEFEHYIAGMFSVLGYQNVCVTPKTGDHGKDIVAYQGKEKIFVECKKYNKQPIGEPYLRGFLGAIISEKADKGYFITTSKFTKNAIEYAKENNIELIDGEKLKTMVVGIIDNHNSKIKSYADINVMNFLNEYWLKAKSNFEKIRSILQKRPVPRG